MVNGIGEHCVRALYKRFHQLFLWCLQILCLGRIEVLSCLMHVDLGCCHLLGQVLVN